MNILHNQHKHLLVSNRVAFMIIGVLEAAWAPLVPYVKSSFAIDEGTLGDLCCAVVLALSAHFRFLAFL